MRIIDLRSDTVTMPTDAMRRAMYLADVGDDVYGEDPTVCRLEEKGAEIMDKEAGLFVASGTMGNQIAAMVHTRKGDEIICEAESHIYYFEVAGLACLSGAQPLPLTAEKGILTADKILKALRPKNVHVPRTSLICVENTHNRAGGTCYPLAFLADIKDLAKRHNIAVHMDGARIFNAAAAQKVEVKEIACHADSIQFCLSKGLGAPVGSLLVGNRQFISEARRYRKMLGGGMRQAGIIAAAGMVALTEMVQRLEEDHVNARILAEALATMGFNIELGTVQTNIVIFNVEPMGIEAGKLIELLGENGIKASQFGECKIRMVTHFGVTREDIEYTIDILSRIITGK